MKSEVLDKKKIVDWVYIRLSWYWKGDAVQTEFNEFMNKLNSGFFNCEEKDAKEAEPND